MGRQSLSIPLLIDPLKPDPDTGALPVQPTHIASWSIDTPAGPSRAIALAAKDNSIWIRTAPELSSRSSGTGLPGTSPSVPRIQVSRGSSASALPSNAKAASKSQTRSRATSSSSHLSTSSTTARRRGLGIAFSPPSSATNLPSTSLSSVTASAPSDSHHRNSITERDNLLEQLREQANEEDDTGTNGALKTISGIGRRGLTGVHGKEDYEDGSTSPRSVRSVKSAESSTTRTFSDFLPWRKGDEDEKRAKELKERIEEVEVDREMNREKLEDEKEEEEARVIEQAARSSMSGHDRKRGYTTENTMSSAKDGQGQVKVTRVFLSDLGRGRIVDMKAVEGVGLCVLRDVGLLNIYAFDTFDQLSAIDLEQSQNIASSSKSKFRLTPYWHWRGIDSAKQKDDYFLVLDAIPWPCNMPSPNGDLTHVALVSKRQEKWNAVSHFDLAGVGHVALQHDKETSHILHFLPDTLHSYPIVQAALKPHIPPQRANTPLPRAVTSAFASPNLSLLRPSTPAPSSSLTPKDADLAIRRNKSFTSLRTEKDKESGFAKLLSGKKNIQKSPLSRQPQEEVEAEMEIGECKEVERNGYNAWKMVKVDKDGYGVGATRSSVDIFVCDGKKLDLRGSIAVDKACIGDITVLDKARSVLVVTQDSTVLYTSANSTATTPSTYKEVASFPLSQASYSIGPQQILLATSAHLSNLDTSENDCLPDEICSLKSPPFDYNLAKILPFKEDKLFISDSRGKTRLSSWHEMCSNSSSHPNHVDNDELDSRVTVKKVLSLPQGDVLVAGDEDGTVHMWQTDPFKLENSIALFADPVHSISYLDDTFPPCLAETVLITSEEGTIAVISAENLEQKYLIPASRVPRRRLFVGGKDILLTYANGKARVWNLESCEFRRSTGLDAAEDMLQSGTWLEIHLHDVGPENGGLSSFVETTPNASDIGRLFKLDLASLFTSIRAGRSEGSKYNLVKSLLSLVMTWKVNAEIDAICTKKLGISLPAIGSLIPRSSDGLAFPCVNGGAAWQVSPAATALRQLLVVSLLRQLLNSTSDEKSVAEVIAYYSQGVLDIATPPSLDLFVAHYMDTSVEIHQTARLLFSSAIDRMSENDVETLIEDAQSHLPSNVVSPHHNDESVTQSLTLVGGIAIHKYQSVSPIALKAVADSLNIYLSDFTSSHLPLAIELASKGFTIWQTYLDPMDLLRSLFKLSTQTPPSASVSAQARLAVLHVANLNPALFMSTLSIDILDAKTTEGRTSIMKLCVFMARKNPGVLENGLPRIAEAVVKSLDPNIAKMREEVWEAATVILNELVLAFSTIDFCSATQRLAVGTHEGAVIMYDLKSASRLYVLEPHHGPVSSVNFSPDGRRLLTVSLEDGDVTVWKVGSSISGFFNVGGPPRQGNSGGPFKRIEFKRADDEPLEETSALSDIKVEWPANRSAKVMIKETALSFET